VVEARIKGGPHDGGVFRAMLELPLHVWAPKRPVVGAVTPWVPSPSDEQPCGYMLGVNGSYVFIGWSRVEAK
jgi:hypothetical protein